MSVYIFLQVILLFFVCFSLKYKKFNNVGIFFAFIFIITIGMFRYEVGIDYNSYSEYFVSLSKGEVVNVEYGFVFVSHIAIFFGLGFQGVIAVYSFLSALFINAFYCRFSDKPLLSIYIYAMLPILYLSSFNVIRQFLAVAIFAYSIRFIVERKFLFYVLLTCLSAFLVHKSAVLMLPLYFFLARNPSAFIYFVAVFFYFFTLKFVDFVIIHLGFSGIYTSEISHFKNTGVNNLVLVYLLLFIFILFIRDKLLNINKNNIIFINMVFLSVLVALSPLFTDLPSAPFLRLTTFFTIALPVILVNTIPALKYKFFKWGYFLSIILLPAAYFYFTLVFKGGLYKLTPYQLSLFH
jgi:hypothetical protein